MCLLLLFSSGSTQPSFRSFPHVRSTQRWVLDLIRTGAERSITFRGLVAAFDRTDTIVYVERGLCGFGHLSACVPQTVVVAAETRYVRVMFDARRGAGAIEVLALIGHELQHALEIATATEVRTAEDAGRLFRRIGFSPHCPAGVPDCYETDAARQVGDRIRDELTSGVVPGRAAKR